MQHVEKETNVGQLQGEGSQKRPGLETLHRRHLLALDYIQRQNRTFHLTSKLSLPYDQVYG